MGTGLSIHNQARLPGTAEVTANRAASRRPFAFSSFVLAVYMFTVVVLSDVSTQSAMYSRWTGFVLTYVFLFEFLLTKRRTIFLPWEFGVLALFVLWNIVSLLWASDFFWGWILTKGFIQLLVFWVVSVNIMTFHGSIKPASIGLLAGLVWAIGSAVRANHYSLTLASDTRIGSVLVNSNSYAVALAIGILACLYLYQSSPRAVRWCLIGFAILAVQQIFFFSGSRKGMIGVVALFGLYFGITAILNGRNKPWQIALIVLGIATSYFVVNWLISSSPFGDRLLNFQNEVSFLKREELAQFAVDQWQRSPIIGLGVNQFRVLHQLRFGINTYSHSNYLEIVVGTGLVGLALFYGFYALTLYGFAQAFLNHQAGTADIAWAATVVVLFVSWDTAMVSQSDKLYWAVFAQLAAYRQLLACQSREEQAVVTSAVSP